MWECIICTYKNKDELFSCEMCKFPIGSINPFSRSSTNSQIQIAEESDSDSSIDEHHGIYPVSRDLDRSSTNSQIQIAEESYSESRIDEHHGIYPLLRDLDRSSTNSRLPIAEDSDSSLDEHHGIYPVHNHEELLRHMDGLRMPRSSTPTHASSSVELQEDEELQLALALSMPEAQHEEIEEASCIKSAEELQEEDEFQCAIAISIFEAENKEKKDHPNVPVKQISQEECIFCYCSLEDEPSIQLDCGHTFHDNCCKRLLKSWYNGPRIVFAFAKCPLCKERVSHRSLTRELKPINILFEEVQKKSLMRLEFEGLENHKDIVTPGAQYYNDPTSFAMEHYTYYMCFKCRKAYFGGAAACVAGVEGDADEFNPEELVCPGCTGIIIQDCGIHGEDYIGFKCRYCCSIARWFCFGNTHFCDKCHDDAGRLSSQSQLLNCPVGPGCIQLQGICPLKINHPPTGQEFSLGCGICNNVNEF